MFNERLIASNDLPRFRKPFLTVAIPHYKHRRHLEIVLESIFVQDYDDFDILVSNDCSPDDSDLIIPILLKASNRSFRYYSQTENLGYDCNVRFCLRAAEGRYVFLLGNDDALCAPNTLSEVAEQLKALNFPDVAYVNFEDWVTGQVNHRASATEALGTGIELALARFRKFSFVSGLIFDHDTALRHETDKWDRSIFYQIYLACRIIAARGYLAAINISAVRKDVRVDGSTVPNYITKLSSSPWSFVERHTGVDSVLRVTWDAIEPYVTPSQRSATLKKLLGHGLITLHPYWVMEYRRIANWSAGYGVARNHWPRKMLKEYTLDRQDRVYLWIIYIAATVAALLLPIALFKRLKLRITSTS